MTFIILKKFHYGCFGMGSPGRKWGICFCLRFFVILLGVILFKEAFADDPSQPETGHQKQVEASGEDRKEEARRAYKENQHKAVIKLLEDQIKDLDDELLSMLAMAYFRTGQYFNETKILQILEVHQPKNLSIRTRLARSTYLGKGGVDKAIVQLREVIEMNRKYMPAYRQLLKIFRTEGNRYELKVLLEVMVEHFGKKAEYLTELCKIYVEDGFTSSAKKTCREAVNVAKGVADNHVYLGLLFQRSEELDQAEKILVQAAKSFPKSDFAQWGAGQILRARNKHQEAFDYFQKAVMISPKSSRALVGLGETALELKKNELSLKSFVTACEIDKSASPAFKKAVLDLHQSGDVLWYSKFNTASFKCQP